MEQTCNKLKMSAYIVEGTQKKHIKSPLNTTSAPEIGVNRGRKGYNNNNFKTFLTWINKVCICLSPCGVHKEKLYYFLASLSSPKVLNRGNNHNL